ncbi:MAG: cysteine hydrolase [Candidatus Bathyarchaeia archaeon]
MRNGRSGRPRNYIKIAKASLVVVDIQNDYCHKDGVFGKKGFDLSHVQMAVENLVPLLEVCRASTLPVIFVRTVHSSWTDSPAWKDRLGGAGKKLRICYPGTWGSEFYKVKPLPGEYVVTKHRFSAFAGTDLHLVLRAKNIETIFLCGITTNVCVESTARYAIDLDFRVVLIEDCCGALSAEEHVAALTNMERYFGRVSNSAELCDLLRGRGQS